MPTIHREDGYAFRIYPNDHPPPHVHVRKGGGMARIAIGDGDSPAAPMESAHGMRDQEVIRAVRIARRRAEIAGRTEPRAASARYDAASGRVVVELRNGCFFAFPAALGQGLRGASPDRLAEVEVTPDGYGLHWEEIDADLAVPALLQGVFGSRDWMRMLESEGHDIVSEPPAPERRRKVG